MGGCGARVPPTSDHRQGRISGLPEGSLVNGSSIVEYNLEKNTSTKQEYSYGYQAAIV